MEAQGWKWTESNLVRCLYWYAHKVKQNLQGNNERRYNEVISFRKAYCDIRWGALKLYIIGIIMD